MKRIARIISAAFLSITIATSCTKEPSQVEEVTVDISSENRPFNVPNIIVSASAEGIKYNLRDKDYTLKDLRTVLQKLADIDTNQIIDLTVEEGLAENQKDEALSLIGSFGFKNINVIKK